MAQNRSQYTIRVLTGLVAINTIIFVTLSFLHFYWAGGGELWLSEVLPTNTTGSKRMEPGSTAAILVAFALLIFAFITIGNRTKRNKHSGKYFRYGALFISIIFLIRAIGDLKLVGFFKTITTTRFAYNDTHFFSPLCLLIAAISLWIFLLNKTSPQPL